MSKPKRVKRMRTAGSRTAPSVYVGRGSKWGNPHKLQRLPPGNAHARVHYLALVAQYENDLRDGLLPVTVEDVVRELRGKDLACWCALDFPCHADVLLRIANAEATDE